MVVVVVVVVVGAIVVVGVGAAEVVVEIVGAGLVMGRPASPNSSGLMGPASPNWNGGRLMAPAPAMAGTTASTNSRLAAGISIFRLLGNGPLRRYWSEVCLEVAREKIYDQL